MDLNKKPETSINIPTQDNDIEILEPKKKVEAHNGEQISLVSVSPNGTYVVTYSRKDDSIEGWIVDEDSDDGIDDGVSKWIPLKQDPKVNGYKLETEDHDEIKEIKVNDDKIVLYASEFRLENIVQMSNNPNPIKLKLDSPLKMYASPYYFKKNGDLVINTISRYDLRQILVYSLQNNKPTLISSYQLSYDNIYGYDKYKFKNREIEIYYYNKIYGTVNGGIIDDDSILWTIPSNYLFQWKLEPLQLEFSYSLGFNPPNHTSNRGINNNEVKVGKDLIIVKCEKGIEIYSKGAHSPIRYIQAEYSTTKIELLCDRYLLVMKAEKEVKEEEGKQHIRLYDLADNNNPPVEAIKIFKDDESENNIFLHEYNIESKKAFGLVNGRISSTDLSDWNCQEFFKSNHVDENEAAAIGWNAYLNENYYESEDDVDDDDYETIGWNSYLNENYYKTQYNQNDDADGDDYETLADIENIIKIFSTKNIDRGSKIINIDFKNKKYKWRINLDQRKLLVYDTNEVELGSKDLIDFPLSEWNILNNNALVLLYNPYMTIYKYDINKKSIKIQYYYSASHKKTITAKEFFESGLPINIDQKDKHFDIFEEWIENFIEDNKYLAKYGQTLLPILIKKKLTSHIESIYSKCTRLVKEDPKRNLEFLNIITLSMKELYKEYPDYITRFNSEMFMILDPFHEKIIVDYDKEYYHFFAFSQEIDVYKVSIFQRISIYSNLFLYYLNDLHNYLNDLYDLNYYLVYLYSFIPSFYNLNNEIVHDDESTAQYIFLVVPYIGFSCYSLKYNVCKDFFYPQSSVFVDTCRKKEFYTNWNGEAIINFKWKKFGEYYYFNIWRIFIVYLICFTIASYPSKIIDQGIRTRLYQTSIVFGFFHLVYELRKLIWNPRKYFKSIWNCFDLSAYLFATITSFLRINDDNTPDWTLSVSCLLLDLKFLFFFRMYFGIYFAIIFGVAKRVFSFLVILAIIVMSFAHAFFILLHPQNYLDSLLTPNSSDPNNPWTLSNTYSQVNANGNINSNEILIQKPDQGTNLFYSYFTSLFAMYRFLTGDQSLLSPWKQNSALLILMAIFSFIVVIYLMNLFIGLLNMAIEKENSRASYLIQKAEILAGIELFYLLPSQRRCRTWFPEVIYYAVSPEKARIYIKEAINKGDWKKDDCDYKILKLLHIEDATKD